MKRSRTLPAPLFWALLVTLMTLAAAAVRGCILCRTQPQHHQPQAAISVYDHEAEKLISMGLEEYLVCVVGAEMPASFPLEALKAQAVAARTYAVRRMVSFGGESCGIGDICTDSTCCQAYSSIDELEEKFRAQPMYLDKLQDAVYSTAGLIATYGGDPIEALYHSAAGGRTEDAQNVFSSALPYLVGVSSPGEEASSKYTQEYNYTPREFANLVNKEWGQAGLKRNRLSGQVEVLSRFGSGQVEELQLGGVTVSGKELRKALGLNSANFTIAIDDVVTIRTTGYGHGVGMSQYGARAMALEGADFEEILKHYYTGIELTDMNGLS